MTNDTQKPIDWGNDEEVVRAAVPHCSIQYDKYGPLTGGSFSTEWSSARQHPFVKAYEAQHNPALQSKPTDVRQRLSEQTTPANKFPKYEQTEQARLEGPGVAYEANDEGYYSKRDADAYMDQQDARIAQLENALWDMNEESTMLRQYHSNDAPYKSRAEKAEAELARLKGEQNGK